MAYERQRRGGFVPLKHHEWREHPPSLKWLFGINVLLLIAYLVQIGAATIATNVDVTTLILAASPILLLLIVGVWILWVGNATGVGVLFAVDALVAVGAAVLAALPTTAGLVGGLNIVGSTGAAFAGVSVLVPLLAFVGLLAGIWAMMDLYDRLALPETTPATQR